MERLIAEMAEIRRQQEELVGQARRREITLEQSADRSDQLNRHLQELEERLTRRWRAQQRAGGSDSGGHS